MQKPATKVFSSQTKKNLYRHLWMFFFSFLQRVISDFTTKSNCWIFLCLFWNVLFWWPPKATCWHFDLTNEKHNIFENVSKIHSVRENSYTVLQIKLQLHSWEWSSNINKHIHSKFFFSKLHMKLSCSYVLSDSSTYLQHFRLKNSSWRRIQAGHWPLEFWKNVIFS